jgi:hypothetical protein
VQHDHPSHIVHLLTSTSQCCCRLGIGIGYYVFDEPMRVRVQQNCNVQIMASSAVYAVCCMHHCLMTALLLHEKI